MAENPYESPAWYEEHDGQRQTSLLRGLVWAVALGSVGFCIPFAVLPFFGFEAQELWSTASPSATVLSVIFASSAIANFTPPRGIGFVRSLLISLCVFPLTLIGMCLVFAIIGIGPGEVHTRRGHQQPSPTIERVLLFVILLAETGAFVYWQVRRAERKMENVSSEDGVNS